ncbi:hypothetical protein RHGRI_006691 [Rhododendron griersonianum]|uniref:MATE efflux family protein n=1 Tax=Rhododendron griersonianum TaxID=479676 RepID=A0AAV6KVP9_9ERIC|nr:hypothetical protein RHGRI_006691 [Rhododendron griersonianum]
MCFSNEESQRKFKVNVEFFFSLQELLSSNGNSGILPRFYFDIHIFFSAARLEAPEELEFTKMDPDIHENLLTNGKGQKGVPSEEKLKDRLWSETKKMWVVAGPAIFTRCSTFGIGVISQAFVGHIGATELAGYALVQTVFLRFVNGILVCCKRNLSLVCHL